MTEKQSLSAIRVQETVIGGGLPRTWHGMKLVDGKDDAGTRLRQLAENEGEAPSAMPAEGATASQRQKRAERGIEGEAPSAYAGGGATLAP